MRPSGPYRGSARHGEASRFDLMRPTATDPTAFRRARRRARDVANCPRSPARRGGRTRARNAPSMRTRVKLVDADGAAVVDAEVGRQVGLAGEGRFADETGSDRDAPRPSAGRGRVRRRSVLFFSANGPCGARYDQPRPMTTAIPTAAVLRVVSKETPLPPGDAVRNKG